MRETLEKTVGGSGGRVKNPLERCVALQTHKETGSCTQDFAAGKCCCKPASLCGGGESPFLSCPSSVRAVWGALSQHACSGAVDKDIKQSGLS